MADQPAPPTGNRRAVIIVLVVAALAGLAGLIAFAVAQDNSSSTSASSTTVATTTTVHASTTTTAVSTTSPTATTSPAATTAPGTAGPTTSGACATVGDQQDKEDAFPNRLSSLIGKDIRTGDNGCFDRLVIELQGTGDFPGWRVRYPTEQLMMGESENPVVIKGNAVLEIRVQSWMTTMDGQGYSGPTDITPTNVTTMLQIKQIENFEGTMGWAVGLDQKRNFAVSVLTGPPRLVVDVQK